MSETTVRLYGLLPMTRRRYIWQVAVGFCLAAGILAIWWTRWPPLRADLAAMQGDGVARVIWCVDAVPWVILTVAALQAVEAWVVLGMFTRKEKESVTPTGGLGGVSPPSSKQGLGGVSPPSSKQGLGGVSPPDGQRGEGIVPPPGPTSGG